MKRCLPCFLLVMLVLCGVPQSTPAETFAYIPSEDGNVTQVDTTEETFVSVVLTETETPFGAAVTPNGFYLLVTSSPELTDPVDLEDPDNLGTVTRINTSSFLTSGTQIEVGVDPRGVAVDSKGSYAYVANFAADTLSRINMATLSVSEIDLGEESVPFYGPFGVAAIYDEVDDVYKVYVSNNTADTVSVISDDGDTATVEDDDIPVGTNPAGIAITPDGSFVYVANNGSDNVSIIQTSDNTVAKTLSVGDEPWGVAVGSDGDFVYITNSGDNTVTVIATDTQTIHDEFNVGSQPKGVAAPKNGDFAYVVNQDDDDTITRIDMDTQTAEPLEEEVEIGNASALGAFIGGMQPTAPSGLEATEQSYDEIELTWTDNSDDESGFKIERREDSEEGFAQVAKVDADETTFNDDDLRGERTYHYRVRAFNEAADSDYATEASATTEEGRFSWCFIQTLLR